MNTEEKLAKTNYIDFEFNDPGINQQFRFAIITTQIPKKLGSWFKKAQALAIKKLTVMINGNVRQTRYLMMISRTAKIMATGPDIQQKFVNFEQLGQYGITDDDLLLMLMKCHFQGKLDENRDWCNFNATDRLFLIMPNHTKEKPQQRVALEVMIDQHVLKLISRIFTEIEDDTVNVGYAVSEGCMKWQYRNRQQIFRLKSVDNQKNLINFFSIQESDYEQDKVSTLHKLLSLTQLQYWMCFKSGPIAHSCLTEMAVDKKNVTPLKRARIIDQLIHKTVTLMIDPESAAQREFAESFGRLWQRTPELATCQIKIITDSAMTTGLNIQILDDSQDSRYQKNTPHQVIQHLIYKNFVNEKVAGNALYLGNKVHLLEDAKIRTLLSQLLIKQDILSGKITFPNRDEMAAAAKFRYYMMADKAYYRLEIDDAGNLTSQKATKGQRGLSAEFERVIHEFDEENGRETLKFTKILAYEDKLYKLGETALRIIPNAEQINAMMRKARSHHSIHRWALLKVANELDDCNRELKQALITKIERINTETITIGSFQKILKTAPTLSWRPKLMATFNQRFFDNAHVWLHLPVKQQIYDDWWNGIYGIGLLMLGSDYYYYVGRNQIIKQDLTRATSLKQVVALDSMQPKADIQRIMPLLSTLMDSGYVRDGQYTVVPFPFKYIREIMELETHGTQVTKR